MAPQQCRMRFSRATPRPTLDACMQSTLRPKACCAEIVHFHEENIFELLCSLLYDVRPKNKYDRLYVHGSSTLPIVRRQFC